MNLTLYNLSVCLVVASGGFAYGFGFASFSTSIGQPGFYKYFNLDPNSSYTASVLGATSSLFAVGAGIGAILQGFLADWVGRKRALLIAALISLIGAAWTAGSPYLAMFITIRLLHGLGLGIVVCLSVVYIIEVAPPHRRGMLGSVNVFSMACGYVGLGWISVGCYHAKNETVQWRLPLALSTVGPLLLLIGCIFIPESPRYLCWVGRNEEALTILKRLHADPRDPEDSSAKAEYIQIARQVEHDKEMNTGYIGMLKKPSWRRRSFLAFGVMFASQATGINGAAAFLVLIFSNLGMTGDMPLILNATYTTVGTVGVVVVGLFVIDRMGRRLSFLIGFPGVAACLLAEAMLQRTYLDGDNKAGNSAAVFFVFMFVIFYQFIDAASFVYTAEIFPTTIRARGMGISMCGYFVGFITFATPAPTALQTIKWGWYLVFAGLSLICEVLFYFFLPETRLKSLEELGALFGDMVVVHLTDDGRGIVEKPEGLEVEEVELRHVDEK
ncbi:hypothetical protein Z517_06094 [Fonsecaea pedrosoi CBS 271.37]|uniref:Unplaced genomic scaffold supercont1.4, whole genome shotgun sequence n=1 Tax=Fonsecaea pedrosoi CBS 271.37 TaxID=1442368 RepID=A0A0D2EYY8_9EURO|nr:uncharacterized protein Z517_06094 [Fonsecaea pedrosoi CBS 271.37]KIW79482.1 hypothetical protein Z517_06094 [Fonsecaea pedrosoi CBS 271.37]